MPVCAAGCGTHRRICSNSALHAQRPVTPGRLPHPPCGIPSRSFPSQETDAASEGPTFVVTEGEEARRVVVVIDVDVIAAARNVVETSADRPVVAEGMEALFDVGVESEPRRKTAGARGFYQLELVVDHVEWKPRSQFAGVGEVVAFVEGEQPPGEKSVGCIPRIW